MKFLIAFALLFLTTPARAATVDLTYDIDFIGIPVGSIHYRIVQDGDNYTLTFDGGFGGLLGIVADADGKATTTGVLQSGRILPQRMDQVTHWGEKERTVHVTFDTAGNVADYGAVPPYSPQGRVLVTANMLQGVLDTQSSLMHLPPAAGANFCNRTVRVFDGRERYDLVFTPAGKRPDELKCAVTPVRIGGHKIQPDAPRAFRMTFRAITLDGHTVLIPDKTVKPFAVGTATIRLRKTEEGGR